MLVFANFFTVKRSPYVNRIIRPVYWHDYGLAYLLELEHRTQARAGLKPMQPMQLHWAPRHGVWEDCSVLPHTPCAW